MELELVSLIVDDYDAAVRFYVDVLGFELVTDEPARTNDGRPKRWVAAAGARRRVRHPAARRAVRDGRDLPRHRRQPLGSARPAALTAGSATRW